MKITRSFIILVTLWSCLAQAATQLPAKSPSGILVNRTVPFAHLEEMDGSADSVPMTTPRWRQAVFELRRSSDTDLGWPDARELAAMELEKVDRHDIPLTLLHARYDRMDETEAIRSNEVFTFAPLRDRSYNGQRLRFSISEQAILQHGVDEIVGMEFDADDGLGFRPLRPGTQLEVSYDTTGVRELRLRVRMEDGRTLQSTALLDVIAGVTPSPTQTWNITASQAFDGIAGTGQAYILLAPGHSEVTNPVVVVEGFDIDNSIDWPVLYDILNRENMLTELSSAGYDAVVLDFTEAVDPIQRNALVLTELIQMVNAVTAPDQSMTLIGASMGGLVSRYALLWLELQAIEHRVRTWITFDSPHGGANIPLGLQAELLFFQGLAAEAQFLLDRLRSPAARQMLLYHIDSQAGTTANSDAIKPLLETEFQALGGWPSGSRRVSIINGSGSMANQGYNAGQQIVELGYDSLFFEIDGDVWAVPNGGSQIIFDGYLRILFDSTAFQLTVAGTLPWDNAPGGRRNTMQQLADVTIPIDLDPPLDIIALHNNHCFIPSISALALDTTDPFYDIAGDPDLLDHTSFDQVYFPAANQGHIAVTAENKNWFLSEIQAGFVVSPISGDTTEDGGTATFSIAAAYAPTADVTIALSSSNPDEGSAPASVVLPAGSTDPVEVTVTGVSDSVLDGDIGYTIETAVAVSADKAYAGLNPADVDVVNLDTDSPSITIVKTADVESLAAPGIVTYTYVVENTGTVIISGLVLGDDNVDGAPVCDSTTIPVGGSTSCSATHAFTQAELDAGKSGSQAPGTCDSGLYNLVTASSIEAQDAFADLCIGIIQNPSIDIEKSTNGEDADVAPGPTITQGSEVVWSYVVTNIGNVTLGAVAVGDDQPSVVPVCDWAGSDDPATGPGVLSAGETVTCTASGTAVDGPYVNIGDVSGTPPAGAPVTDADPSHYQGYIPPEEIFEDGFEKN